MHWLDLLGFWVSGHPNSTPGIQMEIMDPTPSRKNFCSHFFRILLFHFFFKHPYESYFIEVQEDVDIDLFIRPVKASYTPSYQIIHEEDMSIVPQFQGVLYPALRPPLLEKHCSVE